MSKTADIYSIDFPHGTVDGYRRGCHGSVCGSVIACRDVYRRYQGDYSFRKLIDAGMTVAEINEQDRAEREAIQQRDREAARAERRRELAARKPSRVRAPRAPREPKPARVGAPRAPKPREPRPTLASTLGAKIARLHGEGCNDKEIGAALGVHPSYVGKLRRELNLSRVARPAPGSVRDDVVRMHAAGLRDAAIADELGVTRGYVANIRSKLGLVTHRRERTRAEYSPRRDRRPDVAAAHSEGLTDRQIGERLGISHSEVGRLRRDLGLTAHSSGRTGGRKAIHGHGTNACYARGCRRDECKEAARAYHRAWVASRRESTDGVPAEHHGTAYGYQLGCRLRKNCPGETSCADAALAEERRRRREAGIAAAAPRVPAEPVRAHVRALLDGGRSVLAIADQADVSKSGLKTLLYGRSGERKGELPAQIEAEKARRLLALEVSA